MKKMIENNLRESKEVNQRKINIAAAKNNENKERKIKFNKNQL